MNFVETQFSAGQETLNSRLEPQSGPTPDFSSVKLGTENPALPSLASPETEIINLCWFTAKFVGICYEVIEN